MDCTESVVIFTTLSLPVYEHGIYFHLFVSYLISSLVSYSFLKKRVKVLVAQGYPTLCNPMDCSPSGSSVPGILQARMLQWVIVSFSRWFSEYRWFASLLSLLSSHWFMSNSFWPQELQYPRIPFSSTSPGACSDSRHWGSDAIQSNHLIFWCPILLLPSVFPSIRVFSNESVLLIGCQIIGASL